MEHEDSELSESGRTNRWREYPADAWNTERSVLLGRAYSKTHIL